MAPLASIRQMSGQVSRGSVAKYQADERAGVARLRWRVSVSMEGAHPLGFPDRNSESPAADMNRVGRTPCWGALSCPPAHPEAP